MADKTNLDAAVLSIQRVGTFSEGEKDALVKAFRTSGFPGNFSINNPTNLQVLRYDGVNWVNSDGGVTYWTQLVDTPGSITANGFVKGNSGGTALEQVTNVAETTASETISGLWNFTTAPTISSAAILVDTTNIDDLNNVDTTGKISGDFLKWDGANWVDQTLTFDTYNPMTTAEDLIKGGASGTGTRLPVGTNGQVLTVTAGSIGWATPASGFADPMTTRGDVIIRNASNTTARLGVGGAGSYLGSDGTDISWTTPTFADTSPMTTNEDIIKQSGGVATRLPVGTNDQVLTVVAGVVSWATPASGFADPMTTRGDIIIRDATNTTARLGIGANTYVLTSNGTDISWAAPAGGGATTFLGLSDTPGSFAGQGLNWLRVNTGATALEFVSPPVSSVSGTGAIGSTGGTTPVISIVPASGTVPGTMSATHYTKLQGIEAGADVTDAANVAAAGAVMDSDIGVTVASAGHDHDSWYSLLGHNHDASYASLSHNHDLVYAALAHTHTEAQITDLGNYAVLGSAVTFSSVDATGDITAFVPSDARIKTDVMPISSAVDRVKKLNGVSFYYDSNHNKGREGLRYGFIAQDMREVLPELVASDKDGMLTIRETGFEVAALLAEAIKELDERITDLELR